MHYAAIESSNRKSLIERKRALVSREGVAEGGEPEVRAAWRELDRIERALERIDSEPEGRATSAPTYRAERGRG